MKKSIIIAAAAMLPLAAFANGFVAIGGAAEGCHYAVEPTVAAYTASGAASVHHGILAPAAASDPAGIVAVAAPSALSLSFDSASATVSIHGASTSARVTLVAMDGRALPATLADGGSISLSNLAKGIYIVRVADGAACATLKIAL
ncbi:MAG: T9SS type A sorting domain-containing protein [Bacteroidales bacterium]|nr:T9SS type A sorting domain-containing protein [Bacteroidales bacterium]